VSQSLSVNNYRYIISQYTRFLTNNEDGNKSRIVFERRREGEIFFFFSTKIQERMKYHHEIWRRPAGKEGKKKRKAREITWMGACGARVNRRRDLNVRGFYETTFFIPSGILREKEWRDVTWQVRSLESCLEDTRGGILRVRHFVKATAACHASVQGV